MNPSESIEPARVHPKKKNANEGTSSSTNQFSLMTVINQPNFPQLAQ